VAHVTHDNLAKPPNLHGIRGAITTFLEGRSNPGGMSIGLITYDPDGNIVDQRLTGTAGDDTLYALRLNELGTLDLLGTTTGAFDGGQFPTAREAFHAKVALDGTVHTFTQFGLGTSAPVMDAAATDEALVFTGHANLALPENAHAGSPDAFVISLRP